MKRSEEEIRRALNRATMEINNDEDDQILTDAFKELLTLRRRLVDREGLARKLCVRRYLKPRHRPRRTMRENE